jgi:hypothetical protein
MTEEDAAQVLRNHGWTPRFREVHGARRLYAYRRRLGKLKEQYIASAKDLETMTEAEVVAKLPP